MDGRSEEEEETPLHVAARLGHVELADLLLRHGACPDARDAEGWTPLLAACDTRCTSPADAEATTARCLQLCRLLLSAGANPDTADQDKRRPLHLACRRGHAAVVELLLSYGVSVNLMDYGGHTALHCALQGPPAALAQSPECAVRALLNHGAVRVWPGALPKVQGWGQRAGREQPEGCVCLCVPMCTHAHIHACGYMGMCARVYMCAEGAWRAGGQSIKDRTSLEGGARIDGGRSSFFVRK